ncbi:hypothetical protein Ade02nite_82450 [Paractinoplanes deccanensis]|uniref:PHP domain-containing protein n=1 Tax=Paractinoplanes deccanensis TaxID=113561 RepID=A0ABQ3YHV8_9ACTN|nr:CehA/McbA family metallohydrolase [Actinoplanes deccanensis]GID79604.1 hypothetical protein Ade02nite_82450 [Actinoplanes deccanensis]
MAWYRGDLHVHSRRSHAGEMTPGELTAAARAAGLDFFAITEHNTADTHGAWDPGGEPLVILGQEVVTEAGHWLALGLGPGQVIDWRGGVDVRVAEVHRAGGLCAVAHPYAPYPSGTFLVPYDGFDAVEVWNGQWASDLPWNADNEAALAEWGRALRAGARRTAVGNSDVHLHGQMGTPQTVVRADELTAGAILDGLRAGRCWIAESAGVGLSLTARAGDREAGIGERLTTGGQAVVVAAQVRGVPSGTVTVHTGQGVVHSETLPRGGSGHVRWRAGAGMPAFVRVEVRHPGGRMAALSNPIQVGDGD